MFIAYMGLWTQLPHKWNKFVCPMFLSNLRYNPTNSSSVLLITVISISNQCAKKVCLSDIIRGEFPQTCSLETKSVSDADAPRWYCSSIYSTALRESELSLHVVCIYIYNYLVVISLKQWIYGIVKLKWSLVLISQCKQSLHKLVFNLEVLLQFLFRPKNTTKWDKIIITVWRRN